MLEAYKEVIGKTNQNLTNGKKIYWKNVRKLVKFLAENEYDNLMNEYEWTTLVYNAECNFEPIMGEIYHLYERDDIYFLSLIEPSLWKQKHYGSFRLSTDGKWEKVETKE